MPLIATPMEISNGWTAMRGRRGFAIIGYEALTEKGETFLTAYCAETCGDDSFDPDEVTVASGSMAPEELRHFRRMAAAAGVKLADHTCKRGKPMGGN
jgi:hypothetical protein